MLTSWARLRPSRSSFQTTSTSPFRSARWQLSSPGRSSRAPEAQVLVAGTNERQRELGELSLAPAIAAALDDEDLEPAGPQGGIALQVPAAGSRRSSRRGRGDQPCVANLRLRHRRGSGPPSGRRSFVVFGDACRRDLLGVLKVARCRRRERPRPVHESAPGGREDVRLDAAAGGGRGSSGLPGGLRPEDLRGARPRRAARRRRRRRNRGARAARTSSSTATVAPPGLVGRPPRPRRVFRGRNLRRAEVEGHQELPPRGGLTGCPRKSIAGSRSTSASPTRAFETLTSRSTSRLGRAAGLAGTAAPGLPTRRPCSARNLTTPPALDDGELLNVSRRTSGPAGARRGRAGRSEGSALVGEPPARARRPDRPPTRRGLRQREHPPRVLRGAPPPRRLARRPDARGRAGPSAAALVAWPRARRSPRPSSALTSLRRIPAMKRGAPRSPRRGGRA